VQSKAGRRAGVGGLEGRRVVFAGRAATGEVGPRRSVAEATDRRGRTMVRRRPESDDDREAKRADALAPIEVGLGEGGLELEGTSRERCPLRSPPAAPARERGGGARERPSPVIEMGDAHSKCGRPRAVTPLCWRQRL